MEYPKNETELLAAFIRARVSVIGEFSGSIRLDSRKLQRWAVKYAVSRRLTVPTDDETFGIFYEDAEQDAEIDAQLNREVSL